MEGQADLHHNPQDTSEPVPDENKNVEDNQEGGKKKSFLAKGKKKTVLEDKDANETGKSDEAKTANPKAEEAKAAGGITSVKDRMANFQQATSKASEPVKTSAGPVGIAGGSIADRMKAFQQTLQSGQEKAPVNEVKAEVKTGMSIQERMAAMKQSQQSTDTTTTTKPKDVVAGNSVADRIKAMQAGGQDKSDTKSEVSSEDNKSVHVGETIQERMARMQNAMKTQTQPKETVKETDIQPTGESVQERVRRMSTKNSEQTEDGDKGANEGGAGAQEGGKKKSFLAKKKGDDSEKKPVDIGGGPSVQERAEMLRSGSKVADTKEEKPAVKIEGAMSVKERMELMKQQQQGNKTEVVKEEKPTAVKIEGALSVKERMELMKQGKQQPAEEVKESKPAAVKIEGALSVKERMELMKQQQQQGTKTEAVQEEKPKVETGVSVKDRAQNMFKKAEEPAPVKENKVEVAGTLADKMKAFQEATTTTVTEKQTTQVETGVSVKDRLQKIHENKEDENVMGAPAPVKSHHIEGSISLEERKKLLQEKKPEPQREEVQIGNVTVPAWVAKSMMASDVSIDNASPQTKARTSVQGEEEPLYFPQTEFADVMLGRDEMSGKKLKGTIPDFE